MKHSGFEMLSRAKAPWLAGAIPMTQSLGIWPRHSLMCSDYERAVTTLAVRCSAESPAMAKEDPAMAKEDTVRISGFRKRDRSLWTLL